MTIFKAIGVSIIVILFLSPFIYSVMAVGIRKTLPLIFSIVGLFALMFVAFWLLK